ncbi:MULTISPECIES: S1C family serine protease [Paenibacillus]|uniref:S1C family serine protease n=1 Tax=Paenibacillus TaxID=44249 RepID=UPI00061E358C|nr:MULTISPECIES: trypsin-like peptidase domain-containing protein [Paenibacillus]KKC47454.1 hypothetical protein VE23_10310 [Paenibacillus sp. D9]
MEDNRNGNGRFDGFWDEENKKNEERAKQDSPDNSGGERQEGSSYYYSYGPFRQGQPDRQEPRREGQPSGSYGASEERPQEGHSREVVVTPPRQLRPFVPAAHAGKGEWQTGGGSGGKRRGGGFRTAAVSFLAGVIAVGGLMWASDENDWFTKGQALTSSGVVSGQGDNTAAASKVSTAADTTRPMNISQISEKASPAVVLITTYSNASSSYGGGLDSDPFFRQFFGDQFGGGGSSRGQQGGELQETGLGSGFFFEKDGYILTNQHVIDGAQQIKVKVQGTTKELEAKLLGARKDLDLAVLKVEPQDGKDFPTLPLGDSEASSIGDWLVAIGNPNGFDHSVTVGVLSARERTIQVASESGGTARNYQHLLQTDASINPGNSGGPLINMNGEVIGINTAISADSQGIGFAIPTSTIKEVVDQLKAGQSSAPSPFIGATLADITDQMKQELGLSSTEGSIVRETTFNAPAYKAGLQQYDVITGMDGTKYKTKEDLIAVIQKKKVGDKVTMNVIRNGKKMDITIEIGDKSKYNVE